MVSNRLLFDPALVRALARELNDRLAGRACAPTPRYGEDRSATLELDRGEALRFDLHPARGWVRLVRGGTGDGSRPKARITAVSAPEDERILHLDILAGNRFKHTGRRLIVELHAPPWNALLLGDDDRILSALQQVRSRSRIVRPGTTYEPPPPRERIDVRETEADARESWMELLSTVAPGERAALTAREFAWTAPFSAAALLGDATRSAEASHLEAAFDRWWAHAGASQMDPVVLQAEHGPQPYPHPLPGLAARPCESLLDAFGQAREEARQRNAGSAKPEPSRVPDEAVREAARKRLAAARRKADALRVQMGRAADIEALRGRGDLLLARLHEITPGSAEVTLEDFNGERVVIDLDPRQSATDNAERLYGEARRMERGQRRLPKLLADADAEVRRWSEAVEKVDSGEVPKELGEDAPRPGGHRADTRSGQFGARLPYRAYRTSGGLEVRVGRSARDNHRLTFRHAAPDDIWLHAQSVPGSHVILRWPRRDQAPPARDLREAAVLAAVHSGARTSATVPVVWTRRRHVRKPRGAAPGAVIPSRVATLFVEPDEAVETRLRM